MNLSAAYRGILAVFCAVMAAYGAWLAALRFGAPDPQKEANSIEVDMLVSRGNIVELWVNDWQHPPEDLPVVAGERHIYQFKKVPREVTLIRLDPTEQPDARIVIYSLAVKSGDRIVRQFGPAEMKSWTFANLSTPREENGGLVLQDTNDDPIVWTPVILHLPGINAAAQPSWLRVYWPFLAALGGVLLYPAARFWEREVKSQKSEAVGGHPALDLDQRLFVWLPSVFALLGSLLGIFYVFTTPPLQVPDEFAHVFRAYGLSEGHFVAPALTPIPRSLAGGLLGQFPPHVESARKITADELFADLHVPLRPEDEVKTPNEGMNVNTWIPYVPSAIAIGIARLFQASPLAILYLGRLANLAGYTVLTWLALRLLPAGRVVLLTIALMPMVLHQAAGLSWDSIVFGFGFVFCALVVRYASAAGGPLLRRDYMVLSAMVLIISLCKVDFALLPLLALIPTGKFMSLKKRIGFLCACVTGALAANTIWQYLNRANLELFKQSVKVVYHTNLPDNIWYLYYDPGLLFNAAVRSVRLTGFFHLRELVGVFGWLYVVLPEWAVYTYVLLLLAAALTSLSELRLTWMQRAILLGVALLGSFACVLAMWLQTPDAYIQNNILHNVGTFYGIQGRHFIPFVMPALLLLSNRFLRLRLSWFLPLAVVIVLLVNVDGLVAIKRAYYAEVSPIYAWKRQPQPGRRVSVPPPYARCSLAVAWCFGAPARDIDR